MTNEEFKRLLKNANLNKKQLAEILGIAQQTVNCWGTTQNIPYWVETWLENYIKAKDMDTLIHILKSYMKYDDCKMGT